MNFKGKYIFLKFSNSGPNSLYTGIPFNIRVVHLVVLEQRKIVYYKYEAYFALGCSVTMETTDVDVRNFKFWKLISTIKKLCVQRVNTNVKQNGLDLVLDQGHTAWWQNFLDNRSFSA